MSEAVYVQLLNLTSGVVLLTAVLMLWRRELAAVIRVFTVQGVALAGLVAVVAVHEGSAELGVFAVGVLALRAGLLPHLLRRALTAAGPQRRETRPLVNVAASLLAAAGLTLLALRGLRSPWSRWPPHRPPQAIPVGMAVVLIGFFVLVTRRRALSQLVGFLLMDNGITAVGFLTTAGIGLVVELGSVPGRPARGAGAERAHRVGCRPPSATPTSTSCGSCTTDDHPADCSRPSTVLVALVLLAPVLLPLLTAAIYLVAGWGPRTAWLSAGSAVVVLAAVITLAAQVSTSGPRTTAGGLLRADALSAFMLLVVAVVALVACAATPAHLRGEISAGRARTRTATQHSVLVQVFLSAMALAVLASSLGLLWVAVEATTIVTAFLVGQRRTRAAVEAAWKYVVICSTGIAMALLGTFLLNYAAGRAGRPVWTGPG